MNLQRRITVSFTHRLVFTEDAFSPENPALLDVLQPGPDGAARVLAFIDTHVARHWPDLPARLRALEAAGGGRMKLIGRVQPVVGGEMCKNDRDAVYRALDRIHRAGIDRHSYMLVVGGGAVLDCIGLAAALAHRGVRLVRLPTTTLAQADSGVGVKNAINGFGEKNFLGTFAVPWAVINDRRFLTTLPDAQWRDGFSEAVKVALLKDAALFERIERQAAAVRARDMDRSLPIIERSAMLHLEHIAGGGDPFEMTTARPLDFGHWAAHRIETLSDHRLSHGHAVAIGLALDVTYSHRAGLLPAAAANRILACLEALGFELYDPALEETDALMQGLESFRAHLGGELTITLLGDIGRPVEVHRIDTALMADSAAALARRAAGAVPASR